MTNSSSLRLAPACYHVLHLIPPMVAHEMNYFMEEGLSDSAGFADYTFITGGIAPFTYEKETLQQAMKEKGIDVAMDVHPSTVAQTRLDMRKDLPELVILAGWRNNNPNCLIAAPGIETFQDLKGKAIGCIDEKDNLVKALSPVLVREGMNPHTDVIWERGWAPQKNTKALRDGTLEVAFIPSIDIEPLLEDGFNNLFNIVEEYPKGRPDRVIVATKQAVEEKRDEIKAFVKGMMRAYWFMRFGENFNYLRNLEIRLRRDSYDKDERSRPLVNKSPKHSEILPFPYDAKPTQLDAYLHEAVAMGELDAYVPSEQLVDFSLLEEAFAELEAKPELKPDIDRAREICERWGF